MRTHCRELKKRRSCIRTAMPSSMLPIGLRLRTHAVFAVAVTSSRQLTQRLETHRKDGSRLIFTATAHTHTSPLVGGGGAAFSRELVEVGAGTVLASVGSAGAGNDRAGNGRSIAARCREALRQYRHVVLRSV